MLRWLCPWARAVPGEPPSVWRFAVRMTAACGLAVGVLHGPIHTPATDDLMLGAAYGWMVGALSSMYFGRLEGVRAARAAAAPEHAKAE